jgi:hypothetical protein
MHGGRSAGCYGEACVWGGGLHRAVELEGLDASRSYARRVPLSPLCVEEPVLTSASIKVKAIVKQCRKHQQRIVLVRHSRVVYMYCTDRHSVRVAALSYMYLSRAESADVTVRSEDTKERRVRCRIHGTQGGGNLCCSCCRVCTTTQLSTRTTTRV